jgi:hypothetical protein
MPIRTSAPRGPARFVWGHSRLNAFGAVKKAIQLFAKTATGSVSIETLGPAPELSS